MAFQGERGAFSEIISNKIFPQGTLFPCKTFKEVFNKISSQFVDIGVIPIENSYTGRINEPTHLLINSDFTIIAEGMLRVVHCLISTRGNSIKNIRKIYGHPEALIQSKGFLKTLNCEVILWYDGAGASKLVKEEGNSGLIASERVAEIYGLEIIKKAIQDSKDNITRFFVISKKNIPPTANDKTSLVFSTDHTPGSLFNALKPLAKYKINLTRVESMPSNEKPWQYQFLVDFDGHKDDSKSSLALKELEKCTSSLKVLGSYPKGELFE
ncbi:MAG: prephenate dehydratase [Candidatus Hodarchaeales archaeon]